MIRQLIVCFNVSLCISRVNAGPGNCLICLNGTYLICRNVLSIDEYASCFDGIDPLAQHKKWTTGQIGEKNSMIGGMADGNNIVSRRVQAAFVVSDSVDWSRDIQVLLTCFFLFSVVGF